MSTNRKGPVGSRKVPINHDRCNPFSVYLILMRHGALVEKVCMRQWGSHNLMSVLIAVVILSTQFGMSYTVCRDLMSPTVNGSCTSLTGPTSRCHASDCLRMCQFAPEDVAYDLPAGNSGSLLLDPAVEVLLERLSLGSLPCRGFPLSVGPIATKSPFGVELYLLNASFLI